MKLEHHKQQAEHEFYVTFSRGQTKDMYGSGYADLTRFRRDRWRFASYYLDGMIRFESYEAVAVWEKYLGIS